jgi:hypothetical protein
MFGRNLLSSNNILQTRVSADGQPHYKAGGIAVDWANSITALGSDTTYPDGSLIRSGNKVLRYGQVVTKIAGGTNTLTSTATGGTVTLTVTTASPVGGAPSQTTAAIAFGATAAAVATAIGLLTNVGAGNVSGSGGPLGTGAVTLTFAPILGTVTVAIGTNSLTGGSLTIGASLGAGNTQGFFGPYDPAASDGRQTLTRGECFIMDETILQYPAGISQLAGANDQVGSAIEGGLVYLDRIIQSGTAAHTLALGPTKAELLAAFPMLRFVEN